MSILTLEKYFLDSYLYFNESDIDASIREFEEESGYQRSSLKIIQNLPVIQVYVSDCEGDDIIAHICNRTFNERKCIIVSSDKDFYQCISSRVKQWSPGRKKIMTPENVLSEFGILASNFVTTRAF
ncbi:MAG TPA: hypothetical protein EYQ84_10965, partial [Nitrospinaceae bacterium]|nr:hypothetical protein [Nitrospinaceae bacterium]